MQPLKLKALSHLSGQATRVFWVHGFSSTQTGKLISCNFCVYFPSRMQGTRAFVECSTWHTWHTREWNLLISYGQDPCTARYGRIYSVVNARELPQDARGHGHMKMKVFQYGEAVYQNDFQILQKLLWMSEIINRYWKLLSDIGNNFLK